MSHSHATRQEPPSDQAGECCIARSVVQILGEELSLEAVTFAFGARFVRSSACRFEVRMVARIAVAIRLCLRIETLLSKKVGLVFQFLLS